MSPRATVATVREAMSQARDVDLLGRPGDQLGLDPGGGVALDLGPWEIRSVQYRPAASPNED
jgi:hypothetical protein